MRKRSGFTLIEVLVALAIGAMLLMALYSSLFLCINGAATGRARADQSNTVRAVIARITTDTIASLPPLDPVVGIPDLTTITTGVVGGTGSMATGTPAGSTSGSSASGSTTSGSTTSGSTTSGSTTSGTTGSTTSGSTTSGSTSGSSSSATTPPVPFVFNLCVQGTSDTLTLFVTQPAREALAAVTDTTIDTSNQMPSDMRRITYWMVMDGQNPVGLARQEIKWVTSDTETAKLPPDVDSPQNYVFAEQVSSMQFEYFDGTEWQPQWNGLNVGSDGVNPQGPPSAIRITMQIDTPLSNGAGKISQTIQHVIALQAANVMTADNASNQQQFQQAQQQQQQQQQSQQKNATKSKSSSSSSKTSGG